MKLKSIKKIQNESKRYDIQTECSNFFANNILIHNSTCIVDFVNNQFNIRTRGTSSYHNLKNAQDFELLLEYFPKIKDFLIDNSNYTFLFEIITPNNVIVLKSEKVEFFLIDIINKTDYSYLPKNKVKEIAGIVGDGLTTPEIYNFNSLVDISNSVEAWKGKEGVVLSYNGNQNKIKLKSSWYKMIHSIKSSLNSESNFVELYVNLNLPEYNEFFNHIADTFDFELAEFYRGDISRLCEAGKKVKNILDGMKEFVHSIRNFPTRKDQALHIQQSYGQTARAGVVFKILDGKEIDKKDLTKLIWQCLKNN